MLWIGEVEDAKSIDDLITSASRTGIPVPDFENLDFNSWESKQETSTNTSHHSRKKSSVREEITYRQTDCLEDLRLLQN